MNINNNYFDKSQIDLAIKNSLLDQHHSNNSSSVHIHSNQKKKRDEVVETRVPGGPRIPTQENTSTVPAPSKKQDQKQDKKPTQLTSKVQHTSLRDIFRSKKGQNGQTGSRSMGEAGPTSYEKKRKIEKLDRSNSNNSNSSENRSVNNNSDQMNNYVMEWLQIPGGPSVEVAVSKFQDIDQEKRVNNSDFLKKQKTSNEISPIVTSEIFYDFLIKGHSRYFNSIESIEVLDLITDIANSEEFRQNPITYLQKIKNKRTDDEAFNNLCLHAYSIIETTLRDIGII